MGRLGAGGLGLVIADGIWKSLLDGNEGRGELGLAARIRDTYVMRGSNDSDRKSAQL